MKSRQPEGHESPEVFPMSSGCDGVSGLLVDESEDGLYWKRDAVVEDVVALLPEVVDGDLSNKLPESQRAAGRGVSDPRHQLSPRKEVARAPNP